MALDVLRRTWIAMAAWIISGPGLGACGSSSRGPPAPHCPDRGRALSVALRELVASGDVEGPAGVVAGFDEDAACPSGGVEARVRCHLARSTVEVTSRCMAGGWLFVISLPELSDHVHRARVWPAADGGFRVEIASEN
jgi:hypothetical protein